MQKSIEGKDTMKKHPEDHSDKANRIPVSMRLPFEIVEAVEEYAAKNGLRKTDAYLHFLQRGVESEGDDLIVSRMNALEEKIDAMVALIQVQSNEQTATEETAAELPIAELPIEKGPTQRLTALPNLEPAREEAEQALKLAALQNFVPASEEAEEEESVLQTTPDFENEKAPTSEAPTAETPAINEALASAKAPVSAEVQASEALATIEAPAIEEVPDEEAPAIEEAPESEIERVRAAVEEIASRYPAILQVYLFGSVARGTANEESNIDLKLELDSRKTLNPKEIEAFCEDVGQLAGREVDVITTLLLHNKPLVEAYEREKVLVYERAQRFSLPSIEI